MSEIDPADVAMSLCEAREMLERVRKAARDGDDEQAHALEDELRERALRDIAHRADERHASELAHIALESSKLAFNRWCA